MPPTILATEKTYPRNQKEKTVVNPHSPSNLSWIKTHPNQFVKAATYQGRIGDPKKRENFILTVTTYYHVYFSPKRNGEYIIDFKMKEEYEKKGILDKLIIISKVALAFLQSGILDADWKWDDIKNDEFVTYYVCGMFISYYSSHGL
jgi:hypothetical protein